MSQWQRFCVVTDTHGDKVDVSAEKAFFKFQEIWNPAIKVHAGDVWDLRPLRRGATEDERRELLRIDFDAGLDFILRYQPQHLLFGNHDERLRDLALYGVGPMREYGASLLAEAEREFKRIRCKTLPYDRRFGVLEMGKLRVIHGFTTGVNAARRAAQAYGSVLQGHVHSIQSASIEGVDNRVGRSIGCLCSLDMPYARAFVASLVHRHGWAYGVIHKKTGYYHVWQAEKVADRWVIPSDIVEIRG